MRNTVRRFEQPRFSLASTAFSNRSHSWDDTPMRFNRTARLLHMSVMIAVLMQLLSEQLMKVPKPGETVLPVEAIFLGLHEWNGFVVLALAVFYLMYLSDNSDDWKRLFPWLSASGCKGLWQEIRFDIPGWLKGQLKEPAEAHYIAGTVHGLGILLTIVLGCVGIMIFMGLESSGEMNEDIKLLRELHSDLGTLLWIYVIGHTCMALLHQFCGHNVLREMFNLKTDEPET
jgi:cytochrome b561